MDQNPYPAPQTEQQSKRWPVGLYLLLAFVVIPVIVGTIWIVYRIAAYGLFLPQH
jgi:heme/copper-type cytochrome/quinol oxidase subunit 4